MGRKVHVEVTEQDIARGRRQSSCECPIAQACHRHGYAPVVGRESMNLTFEGMRYTAVPLPIAASRFIDLFDGGDKSVQPFSFDLELP